MVSLLLTASFSAAAAIALAASRVRAFFWASWAEAPEASISAIAASRAQKIWMFIASQYTLELAGRHVVDSIAQPAHVLEAGDFNPFGAPGTLDDYPSNW